MILVSLLIPNRLELVPLIYRFTTDNTFIVQYSIFPLCVFHRLIQFLSVFFILKKKKSSNKKNWNKNNGRKKSISESDLTYLKANYLVLVGNFFTNIHSYPYCVYSVQAFSARTSALKNFNRLCVLEIF